MLLARAFSTRSHSARLTEPFLSLSGPKAFREAQGSLAQSCDVVERERRSLVRTRLELTKTCGMVFVGGRPVVQDDACTTNSVAKGALPPSSRTRMYHVNYIISYDY